MSRTKKSRKPGTGSSGPIKADKKVIAPVKEKRPKNKKGKMPGNRQQEAMNNQKQTQGSSAPKDARIGSKKPIDLGVATAVAQKQPKPKVNKKPQPIAAIRTIDVAEPDNTLEEQLYSIEQDPRLLAIIEKQEDDVELSEAEVSLFNELMEQHQDIREQLGWDEDESEDENNEAPVNSEDELWDKFDNSDLSKFE